MERHEIQNATGLDGRKALRAYITSHYGWNRMRIDNGIDVAIATMLDLKLIATALRSEMPLDRDQLSQFNAAPKEEPKVDTPPAAPKADTPPATPKANGKDDESELETLRRILGHGQPKPQTVDEAQVKAIVEEHVKTAIADATNVVRIEIRQGEQVQVKDMGSQHKQFPMLVKILSARHNESGFPIPVWLGGPAGAGKTYACKNAAKAFGVEFYHQPSMLMPHDLLGYRDGFGKYRSTQFVEAYIKGGFVLLDEVDSSENSAILALKGAMANGHIWLPIGDDGAMVKVARHKDCYILAAANTWGLGATADYIGRNKLDAAFLDEFIKIDFAYDERFERSISGNIDWAVRVQKARSNAKAKGLKAIISPRATIHGASLIAAGFSEDEAAKLTYLGGLSADQIKMLEG